VPSIYSPVFYIAAFGIIDDFYQSTHFIVGIIIVSIQKINGDEGVQFIEIMMYTLQKQVDLSFLYHHDLSQNLWVKGLPT